MSRANGESIPMIDKDGENVTITHIDPDLPAGKLEGQSAEEIADKWMTENYPNITQDQLNDMGINVEFVPGEETFELKDENGVYNTVTEDEYNEAIGDITFQSDGAPTKNKLETDNNDSTINAISEMGENYSQVGSAHSEPGRIKIHIDDGKMSQYMESELNQELSKEEAKKINKVIESVTGIKGAVDSGKTVKEAYDDVNELLAVEGIKGKKLQVSGIIISVVLEPAIDVADLEDMWDADNGGVANALNEIAKLGSGAVAVLGTLELATGGTASAALLAAGLVCTIVDSVIRDSDDFDIFSINAEDEIEYDFTWKDSNGNPIHYHGTIDLDYDDPQLLINEIYAYFESSKLQISALLDTLRNKRVEIIDQVKQDIEDEMYSLAYDVCIGSSSIEKNDDKAVRALCEIYNATHVLFANPVIQFNCEPEPSSDVSDLLQNANEKNVKVSITYNGLSFTYTVSSISIDLPTSTLDTIVYDGNLYTTRTVILTSKPTIEELNEHCKNYIHSYYQYIYINSAGKKDSYITEHVKEKIVNVGTVKVPDTISEDSSKEADASKASFMSRERNLLAKEMVNKFFDDVLEVANDYATITDAVDKLEQNIVSAWQMVYEDKGGS